MSTLRPELERHLWQRLEAFRQGFRHNVALLGPPGSGKTFQVQLLVAQPPQGLTVLYCPLYRESCRGFVQRFLSMILQVGVGGAAEGSSPAVLLQRAEPLLPKTTAAIRAVETLMERHLYGEAFNRALDAVPLLSEERRQPCVLIFDEFLSFEELGLSHAFHELGKRVMTWPSVLFILTSSSPYRARLILRERLQLLFGQFEILSLDALDASVVSAWLQKELRPVRGGRAMAPFLGRWLGAHPWYLTVFLKRLKELSGLRTEPDPATPDPDSSAWAGCRPPSRGLRDAPGVPRGLHTPEALFLRAAWDLLGGREGIWAQWCAARTEWLCSAPHGSRALDALIHMAEGARTATDIGQQIGRSELSAALQLLLEQDVAQRNGMCWIVPDPVLRAWLSTVLKAQRSDAMLDTGALRLRVERYLRALWTRWQAEREVAFADQVAGLLSRFCDETVALDHKTGRLPKFDSIQRAAGRAGGETYLIAEGAGKRWCCSVSETPLTEQAIATFNEFCRSQQPRPSRKVVITQAGIEENARLLAKSANMWVWGAKELELLGGLYGAVGRT